MEVSQLMKKIVGSFEQKYTYLRGLRGLNVSELRKVTLEEEHSRVVFS